MAGTSIGTHMRLFTARHAGAFVAYCDRAVSSPAKMQEVTGMMPALVSRGMRGRYLGNITAIRCILTFASNRTGWSRRGREGAGLPGA